MLAVPPDLHGTVFTVAEAKALGVSPTALRSRQYVAYGGGLYRTVSTPHSLRLLVAGRQKQLPVDAVPSHLTALALAGLSIGPRDVLHFATNGEHQRRRPGVVVHRFRGDVETVDFKGVRVPEWHRTFVDCGAVLNDRNLLRVGDWLVAQSLIRLMSLTTFLRGCHLDGVQRARRVARLVRAGVASVRESDVRWHLDRAGLPPPEVNADIRDDCGAWLARGDLVFARWKVLVEYDGWQHERDAAQRQWDHLRREQLEAAGWRVIVITSADLDRPSTVVVRVRQALRSRGWVG